MSLSVAFASLPHVLLIIFTYISYSFFSGTFIRDFIYFIYSCSVCHQIRFLKKASSFG